MLTVLGIILVLFSCIAFAVMKIAAAREKIGTTRQMRDVLKRMADQISFTMEPLPDILSRISQEELGETGEFLDELASQLKKSENRSLQEVWSSTLDGYAKRLGLSARTISILSGLGERLGRMSRDIELDNISYTIEELDGEIEAQQALFTKNEKLFRSFGVLVGILIVILFI